MSRYTLLAVLLGLLLLAGPVSRVAGEEEEEYAEGDEEAPEAAEGGDDEKDVVVLTAANFDETIKKHKFVLAEFYAPWCGHCKTLAPHYAKAATILKSHDADVVLGKVDATVETELATKFGVSGYPTLKWFVDGEPTEYKGPRETDGIVSWIKKKSGPATTLVDDADGIKGLEEDATAVVVAYKGKAADVATFKDVASSLDDVLFVETTNAAAAKVAGLTKDGIAMIKNFKGEDRATVTYSGKVTKEALTEWVKGERIPLTLEFNSDNSELIFNSGIKQQVLLWSKPADLEKGAPLFETFKKVSAGFKGKAVFVTVDSDAPGADPVTNYFGLKDATGPVLLGFWAEKNRKYKAGGDLDEAGIKKFVAGVIDGTAPVDYKSAPVPEDPMEGDVTVVVGKSAEALVFDDAKDVLLEVYAPWCGHCKKLEPIYKKLGKRFAKVDSVVIAKMDGTENEHPDIDVKGFPTILFKPAGTRELITFEENDRSLKALTKFIKKHAKVPYELPKKAGSGGEEDAGTTEATGEAGHDEL